MPIVKRRSLNHHGANVARLLNQYICLPNISFDISVPPRGKRGGWDVHKLNAVVEFGAKPQKLDAVAGLRAEPRKIWPFFACQSTGNLYNLRVILFKIFKIFLVAHKSHRRESFATILPRESIVKRNL
jgi:hypothetical protein